DHEQRPLAEAVGLAVGAIAARYRALGLEVRKQGEPKPAVTGECRVAPYAVHGDAEELGVIALELWQHLVIERHLVAAHGAPVGGIECQDHGPAAEIRQ